MHRYFVRGLLILLFSPWSGGWAQSLNELRERYQQGSYTEVLNALYDTDGGEAAILRADAHQKLGQFNEALMQYNRAEELNHAGDNLHLHRGICLVSLNRFEEAQADLLRAYEQNPSESRVPYYFAAMAYQENDFKRALLYLNDALSIAPDYFDAIYLMGAVHYEMGKPVLAEKAFQNCLNLRDDERSRLNLAAMLLEQKQYKAAFEHFDVLVNSSDDDVARDAYYQRGVSRHETRDFKGACEDWANAAALGDSDAQNYGTTLCQGRGKLRKRKSVHVAF
jgi:tetratricopeptide (TPR) repeat protein